jgi:hypothetical protein
MGCFKLDILEEFSPRFQRVVVDKLGSEKGLVSDHLGNVVVTVSDKKIATSSLGNGIFDGYVAELLSANDYYPFGMIMPNANNLSNASYRYEFYG